MRENRINEVVVLGVLLCVCAVFFLNIGWGVQEWLLTGIIIAGVALIVLGVLFHDVWITKRKRAGARGHAARRK